jgi:methionine-rich copper-binding protein CopC
MRLVLAAFALCGQIDAAQAHAHLRTAVPAVGSTVQASPPEVAITFTESVEPRFSTIEVQDAAGRRVDRNDVHTVPANNKVLSVGVPQLAPGPYTVV